MNKLFLVCAMTLVWSFGIIVSEAKAEPIIYGYVLTKLNPTTRTVEGFGRSTMNYEAGLNWHPAVQGDLYRTDMPEPGFDSRYATGYSSNVPAQVFLFTSNYVEGKTYCTYTTHFSINRSTGIRYRNGSFYDCKTISSIQVSTPTPTPAVTPTPIITPTPVVTPTPCPPGLNGECEEINLVIYASQYTVMPDSVQGEIMGQSRVTACVNYANNGMPVPNINVDFKTSIRSNQPNSGGHVDSLHSGSRPLGKLDKIRGMTNSNGCVATNFKPSHIAGIVGIDASIPNVAVGMDILVGVPNLVYLYDGTNYRKIGVLNEHPSSHWGTQSAVNGLVQIADDYKFRYYGDDLIPELEKVSYNDMSLPYGGKFDLKLKLQPKPNWNNNNSSHGEHRKGTNCDTRSNNIPRSRWEELNVIFRLRGSTDTLDETRRSDPHWHLRFLFGASQSSATRTPHSFVESAWWGALERESTQIEWENWHAQIVEAKAQGPAQLLEKVKLLQRNVFSSSESFAVERTHEEFVEAVFWTHLFREPTETERLYWQSSLENTGWSLMRRRKMEFIYEIQASAEFEEVVLGMVDETLPPAP